MNADKIAEIIDDNYSCTNGAELDNAIDIADAIIAALPDILEIPVWLPINSAPRDGTKIKVVSVEDGQWYHSDIAWWDTHSGRFENGESYESWNLTYWMPLREGGPSS